MSAEAPFNPTDNPIPEYLRDVMQKLGRQINEAIAENTRTYDRRVGFVLFCFDFGADGTMSYIANAQREDVLNMLAEFLRHNGRRTLDPA